MNKSDKKFFAYARRNMKKYSNLLQGFSVLFALSSILSGTYVITAYSWRLSQRWNNVPVANADLYGSALLPIICLIAVFMSFAFSIITFFNGFLRSSLEGGLRVGFPSTLHRYRLERGYGLRPFRNSSELRNHFKKFLREYLLLYFPFLLFILFIQIPTNEWFFGALGFIFGLYVIHFFVLSQASDSAYDRKIYKSSYCKANQYTLLCVFLINIFSILPLSAAFLFFSRMHMANYGNGREVSNFDLLIGIVLAFGFDFLLFSRNIALAKFAAILIATLLGLALLFQPSLVGALALRMMGFGGGMPVSMLVRSVDTEGRPQFFVTRGCLAFNVGGQIVIEEFPKNVEISVNLSENCRPRYWLSNPSPEEYHKIFCNLSIYPRSEVAIISVVENTFQNIGSISNKTGNCSK
jgi:hypothetical protein